MDIGNIESQIENIEQEADSKIKEKEALEIQVAHLQDAISRLIEDVELSQTVSERMSEQEKEKRAVEQELDSFRERVGQIETELQELALQASGSEEVLSALIQFGEDVEEGLAILEERQRLIEECTLQLQAVIERLGADHVEYASKLGTNHTQPRYNTSDSSRNSESYFCENVELMQDRLCDSRFFSMGNHAEGFRKYWDNIDKYKYEESQQPETLYVKARDIEGVYLNDREVQNPDGFWTRYGLAGRSKERIIEKARNIPAVKAKLESGMKVDDLIHDPVLGDSASSYFGNPIRVTRCGDFFVFQGDGRHRTLAAQSIDGYIPVVVTGKYVMK